MQLDAKSRRSRTAPPQPVDYFIAIGPADLARFHACERHDDLPTPYLFEASKHVNAHYVHHVRRQTKLYNGYCEHPDHKTPGRFPEDEDGYVVWPHQCEPITYLSRNPKQFNSHFSKESPLVHGITEHARAELRKAGLANAFEFKRSGAFVHDLFQACFTFSFERAARRFRYREELLDHPNCPADTKRERAPFYFPVGSDRLYPDDLFGNEYEEGKSRFFALEVDRNTESMKSDAGNSMRTKLKTYNAMLRARGYQRFGLPNISVLIATTLPDRVHATLREIEQHVDKDFRARFLVKAFPIFASPWRVPNELLEVIKDWRYVGGVQDISERAPS